MSKWRDNIEWGRTIPEIRGRECLIWIDARPPYCDRGNWIAKISVTGTLERDLDLQDGWPRYFFDLDRAKLEVEEWLKKRGQWEEEPDGENAAT